MERLYVNVWRDLIHRIRLGQSDRAIAQDLGLSRVTVRKYRRKADAAGYLDPVRPLPEAATLQRTVGPAPAVPRRVSTVAPYREVVAELLAQEVEVTTIYDRLWQDHGYRGSYSAVLRFVHQVQPVQPRVTVRVHTGPGEEAQVDFGSAGQFLEPSSGQLRPAYAFVMTLGFSRHQYAELVCLRQTSRSAPGSPVIGMPSRTSVACRGGWSPTI